MGTEISEPLIIDKENIDDGGAGIESEQVPEWKDQITIRGLVVSALLGTLFCIITHKLNLTVGIIPSLNVGAGLLGFFFVKSWTGFLTKLGFQVTPFTKQENTVIQTCVVACYGLAFSGGFGSYMIAMDERTYQLIGADYPGNRAEDIKNPGLWWMIGFLFVVSFLGLFSLTPLRKVMILDYKLTYPSGTATAMLINSFHTHSGAELAGKQVNGIGDSCGFDNFPSFGLIAVSKTRSILTLAQPMLVVFFLGLSYLGVSSGPSFLHIAGDWYPSGLESNNFKGLYGYKVFIAIALILAPSRAKLPIVNEVLDNESSKGLIEQRKRDDIFLKTGYLPWFAASGYVALAAISTAAIPIIFPPLKWYLVLVSYIIAPALAFCNSYGTGLTDWSLSSTYGKIGLFIIASLVGSDGGGHGCYWELPWDVFIAPLTFWMFWTAFEVGSPDGPYKAPYAVIFREMAILGIEGFSELPKHCLALCAGFFVGALIVNLLRDVTPNKISQFIPIPMAMAVPFYIGAYFAIDMFVGTVILYIWERINQKDAEDYAGAVASGLICGDGIWTIPSAILSIMRINPPICMYFGPSLSS
ncbi:hypothetical protein V6N12_038015 [Hibiscus sabdariffa]|uniref:Uncharacterized protein n=1 Tax=Hibiscus sabdariffa TaxID=183260 RepID=A0ABR2BWC0_9ROSI